MSEIDIDKLAARRYLYALFQSIFGNQPTSEQREAIDADLCQEAFVVMGLSVEMCDSVAHLLTALRSFADSRTDIVSLQSEYTRLFIGPNKLPAPPWETVYRSAERQLFTRETLEIRSCYKACGLIPVRYPHVADDHLAIELDFMSQLAARAFAAKGDAVRQSTLCASREFLNEHLTQWIRLFSDRLIHCGACESDSLYGAAAFALSEFVACDCAWLEEC